MKAEIKQLWIEALLSGEYEQGQESLSADGKYCCLGVLCALAVKNGVIPPPKKRGGSLCTFDGHEAMLPDAVMKWSGIDTNNAEFNGSDLVKENDGGASFPEIAKIIEEHF